MTLSKNLHQDVFVSILRAIYSDSVLRTSMGFKGGTAAMLFYGLPRFSVDLDFDLLDVARREEVFDRLHKILLQAGTLIDARDKHYTLFFLLSYKKGERGLKVEISKRSVRSEYIIKNYLGISMFVMKEEDMVASKLSALLTRKKFATRDMYDLWFFLKEHWLISEEVVKEKTDLSLDAALKKAIDMVRHITKNQSLEGLGDLLDDEKQKDWVKENLAAELLFQLQLYLSHIEG